MLTPIGLRVRCARDRWEYIAGVKHEVLRGRMSEVTATLASPVEVRRSTKHPSVLLFYRTVPPRLLCAVVRAEDGEGVLITAYPADRIKSGDIVWSGSG